MSERLEEMFAVTPELAADAGWNVFLSEGGVLHISPRDLSRKYTVTTFANTGNWCGGTEIRMAP